MDLISPFKVLKSFSSKEKAEEYAQRLLKDAVESQIISSPKTPNKFDVAVVDPERIDQYFREVEQKSMGLKQCTICGKNTNENRFYKCCVCGFWECETCGTQRLFPNGLPTPHFCNEDEFEFLGNIGSCRYCRRPMGFRSMHQSLRVQMAGKTTIGRVALCTPVVGCLVADLAFVRKEIEVLLTEAHSLTRQLHTQQGNWDTWLKSFDAVMGNYSRLSWSSDYLNTMVKKRDFYNPAVRSSASPSIAGWGRPLLIS